MPETLIVLKSVHHGNTEKVAHAMAEVLHAKIVSPDEVMQAGIENYELIGFGSGVYYGMLHSELRRLIKELKPRVPGQQAFLFTTAGLPFLRGLWHLPVRSRLQKNGFRVIGEFSCRGFDTFGPLWLAGGLNRKHPDERDLARARDFATRMHQRRSPIPN